MDSLLRRVASAVKHMGFVYQAAKSVFSGWCLRAFPRSISLKAVRDELRASTCFLAHRFSAGVSCLTYKSGIRTAGYRRTEDV